MPDLLGQGALCPLYNLLKAFGICGVGHEANFTTRASGETWAPRGPAAESVRLRSVRIGGAVSHSRLIF
jgi:hypothetical protein